jgi:hypothetical protein
MTTLMLVADNIAEHIAMLVAETSTASRHPGRRGRRRASGERMK